MIYFDAIVHILKPEDTATDKEFRVPGKIPPHIRKFGKLPNVEKWLPGDLILVSSIKPSYTQKAIQKVQLKCGYAPEHAQWQHAAVYLGDYGICEATRKGVKATNIYPYIGEHYIRVRRDYSLESNQSWKIAVQALLRQNFSYSFNSIIKIWWQSRDRFCNVNFNQRNTSERAVICSQLYAEAYGYTSGKTVEREIGIPVTPAELSHCNLFDDVITEWINIPTHHP